MRMRGEDAVTRRFCASEQWRQSPEGRQTDSGAAFTKDRSLLHELPFIVHPCLVAFSRNELAETAQAAAGGVRWQVEESKREGRTPEQHVNIREMKTSGGEDRQSQFTSHRYFWRKTRPVGQVRGWGWKGEGRVGACGCCLHYY